MEFTKVDILERNNCITTSFIINDILKIELDKKIINIFFEYNIKTIILINYICDYFIEDIVNEIYYFYYLYCNKEIIFYNIYLDSNYDDLLLFGRLLYGKPKTNLRLNIYFKIKIKSIIELIKIMDKKFSYRLATITGRKGINENVDIQLFYLNTNLIQINKINYFNKDNINKYTDKELKSINDYENINLILSYDGFSINYERLKIDELNNLNEHYLS